MADRIAEAARAVQQGWPVLYPTDTLWGLGVRPTDARGLRRLYAVKERPGNLPVSVAFSSYEEIEPYVALTAARRAVLRRWLPGPYTFLVPASRRAQRAWQPAVLGDAGTIGVRIPDHAGARALLARTGPLTTTSANRHGRPPVRSAAQARKEFGRAVGAYVTEGPAPSGRPSTIVALTGTVPRVVRPG